MNARCLLLRSALPEAARIAATFGLAAATGLFGCAPAAGGDPEYWAPVPGGGGGGQGGGTPAETGGGGTSTESTIGAGAGTTGTTTGTSTPVAEPKLTITFTTVSFGGEYAPKNVGAVWITDANDGFVKTVEAWGKKRIKYVEKWKAVAAGNTVDAVTGATRSSHGTHALEWDMTDVSGNLVPDGAYRVYREFTEQNGAGYWTATEVEKGAAPVDLMPADSAGFIGQHIQFDPGQ